MKSRTLIPIALFACVAAHAADPQSATPETAPAPNPAEQRLRQDMQTLLAHMATSGALGQHPESLHLHLQQPAQRVTDLGVLVDSASAERARGGLRVLGTTPCSTADRLGLRPVDVLVAVNGTSLRNLGADADGRALAAATLKSAVDNLPDAAPLQLDVEREGNLMAMNTPVHSVLLPALSLELGAAVQAAATDPSGGCGRISSFDVAPRGDQQYHAVILQIDGATPGPSGHENYRVSAGEHKLLVAEDIPTNFMGAGPLATVRTRMHTHKELVVNVRANTTAMIAAQLHVDKNTEFQRGLYWDPVMWREIPENCP